ncbi:MAG: hypothetical protein V7719_00245 [Psychroserpens sp.]|uniref:hypothetical protein n=1 Tax=Psychroserpens sp. TaxID=2020870 RepID=UPI003001E5CE
MNSKLIPLAITLVGALCFDGSLFILYNLGIIPVVLAYEKNITNKIFPNLNTPYNKLLNFT